MAASWEELNAKYGAAPAAAGGGDAWAELNAKYSTPAAAKADSEPVKTDRPAPKQKEVGIMDRVRAGMAGVNKGFFSDLAGLPVDTMANVVDLAKAGYGTVVTAAGRPDLAPVINEDRSGVVGSSAWLAKNINAGANAAGLSSPIDNPNPQDPMSRIAHTGGRFAGASVVPSSRVAISPVQQAQNIGMGTLSGLSAGAVGEVAPEYAGVAGMLPSMGAKSAADIMRYLARGDEAGRVSMQQRMHDLEQAGVTNPSAGLASGNRLLQGVENLLSLTPGSMGIMGENRLAALAGLQGKAEGLRNRLHPVHGAAEAGAGIQADLRGAFKERIGNTYGILNDRVGAAVGNSTVAIPETLSTATRLSTPIRGAEATSGQLINPRIAQIAENLRADAFGTTRPQQSPNIGNPTANLPTAPTVGSPSVMNQQGGFAANPSLWNAPAVPNNPLPNRPGNAPAGNGIPNASLWNAQKEPGIPFNALKDLRTRVGKETQSNAIMGTPEQGEFKQLYGAMSQDMKAGVALADLLKGTKGTQALERANTYYSNAMARVEAMNNIAGRSTPEGAYNAVANSLSTGPTTFGRVRNAVTTDTRQKIVATIVDDLGRATPGQQNADGSEWSPRTFVTNYNRIDPAARKELFKRMPGGEQYARDLETIAKAADMVNQGAKVMANPSGTAAAVANRGTISALTVGVYFYPMVAAATAGGLAMGNATARLLTNQGFVRWLADTPKVTPENMTVHTQRILRAAEESKDAQFRDDVYAYMRSVQQVSQGGQ